MLIVGPGPAPRSLGKRQTHPQPLGACGLAGEGGDPQTTSGLSCSVLGALQGAVGQPCVFICTLLPSLEIPRRSTPFHGQSSGVYCLSWLAIFFASSAAQSFQSDIIFYSSSVADFKVSIESCFWKLCLFPFCNDLAYFCFEMSFIDFPM